MKKKFRITSYSSFLEFGNVKLFSVAIIIIIVSSLSFFGIGLGAPSEDDLVVSFQILPGDGFKDIVSHLDEEGVIRSPLVFELFAFFTGSSHKFKPGIYELNHNLRGDEIISHLVSGARDKIVVPIPEGLTIYEIDKLLSDNGVIESGRLIDYREDHANGFPEGRLFPDTYEFFLSSDVEEVIDRMIENFKIKAEPLLNKDPENFERNLTLASLIQEEVPFPEDQKLVAGIFKERIKIGMPLQIDATICYIKEVVSEGSDSCYPISPVDFKIDSPYNTYLYKGWPPGPIANPGISAILAALSPKDSSYLFYISDPETGKTIFSETLDEHNHNISIYLKS